MQNRRYDRQILYERSKPAPIDSVRSTPQIAPPQSLDFYSPQQIFERLTSLDAEGDSGNLPLGTIADAMALPALTITSNSRKTAQFIWMKYVLPILAAALVVTATVLTLLSLRANHEAQMQIDTYTQDSQTAGEHVAAADSPTSATDSSSNGVAVGAYATSPHSPKVLQIPSLAISARVTEVGLNSKGDIGTPANIKDVSWYDGSSSPQDTVGSTLIVGHVGTTKYPGVFASLYKLQKGDKITIVMGDNQEHTYAVTGSESIPESKLDVSHYLDYSGATNRQLHLITCTGDFNAKSSSYNQRLVISASEI